jgi:uncharacterized DUF497 family protein
VLRPSPGKGEKVPLSKHPASRVNVPYKVLHLYIQASYEWDDRKNRINQKKHGVSFALAALALEDQICLIRPDRMDQNGGQRWHAIGAAQLNEGARVVLLVVHVYREEIAGQEIVRIISARRADRHEVKRYQQYSMA